MLPPVEECVYPDVGGDENKKRERKDLAVVQRVVDVGPVGGAEILRKLKPWDRVKIQPKIVVLLRCVCKVLIQLQLPSPLFLQPDVLPEYLPSH